MVEGAGAVGGPLCDLLAEAGAGLVVSDIDAERARAVADRTGADIVDPEDAFDTPCDLFSPCATGAVLNAVRSPDCGVVWSPAPRTTNWRHRSTLTVSRRPASSTRPTTW